MDREGIRIERRELLAVSAAAIALSAGCFGDESGDDSATSDENDGFGYGGVPIGSGDTDSSDATDEGQDTSLETNGTTDGDELENGTEASSSPDADPEDATDETDEWDDAQDEDGVGDRDGTSTSSEEPETEREREQTGGGSGDGTREDEDSVVEEENDDEVSESDGESDDDSLNPVYGVQNYGEYGYGGVVV